MYNYITLKQNVEEYDDIPIHRQLGAILGPLEKHSGDTGQKMYFSHWMYHFQKYSHAGGCECEI